MTGFILKTSKGNVRFKSYIDEVPQTCIAFKKLLPFTKTFFHARVYRQEIWIDNASILDIIQENASVFTEPGEVVFGPLKPIRAKTSNCMGIYYGEGKGLDFCNIFAKVFEEDFDLLKSLGDNIWKNGTQNLIFDKLV